MKRSTLLLLAACFSISTNKAQHWCFPGSTWHYATGETTSLGAYRGIAVFKYTGDTTLNTFTTQMIKGTLTGTYTPSSPTTSTVTPNFLNFYTRETNNVLFLYNGSDFDTVVNYSAVPGDKWLVPRKKGNISCNARPALTVSDTAHVIINGLSLRRIITTYTNVLTVNNSTMLVSHTNTFVARVYCSLMGEQTEMFPTYCDKDNFMTEYAGFRFRCYKDNNFSTYNLGTMNCDDFAGLPPVEGFSSIRAYPNPANDLIFIEGIETAHLQSAIYDPFGKEVYTCVGGKLQISQLNAGIYFLKINNEKEGRKVIKVIKE